MNIDDAFAEADSEERVAAFRSVWGPHYPLRNLIADSLQDTLRGIDGLDPRSVPVVLSLIDESICHIGPGDESQLVEAVDTFLQRPGNAGDRFPVCIQGDDAVKISAITGLIRLIARHLDHVVEFEPIFIALCDRWWGEAESASDHQKFHFRYLSDFDPQVPYSTSDCLCHIQQVRQWLGQADGSYRVFLPVTHKEDVPGALIAVEIAAVEIHEDQRPEDGIVVAPWTFFLPSADTDFTNLCDALKEVLKGAKGIDAARLDKLTFVLDLRPLTASDIRSVTEEHDEYERITALWPLIPSGLDVEGPSLGVAVGLAAWAAASQRLLRPVIATGSLDAKGAISWIGGLKQKIAAAAYFYSLANGKCSVVVPRGNREEMKQVLAELRVHHLEHVKHPATFQELLIDPQNYLTDGFDDWRNFVGLGPSVDRKIGLDEIQFVKVQSPGTWKKVAKDSDEEFWATWTLINADGSPGIRIEGQLPELVPRLVEQVAKTESHGLSYLTISFGDNPEIPAHRVFDQLVRTVWATKERSTLPDELVVLPINLADAELSRLAAPALAIADAMQARFSLAIEDAAVSNSARQPGKLVLVVCDNDSIQASCWDEERFEPQRLLIAQLKELAKTQWVVAICSDYHHECLWDDPLKKLREVPTVAADN